MDYGWNLLYRWPAELTASPETPVEDHSLLSIVDFLIYTTYHSAR